MTHASEAALYPYRRCADEDAAVPAHKSVVVVGAGPVGLACAIDLAQAGVDVVVVDENDSLSTGSRAICFAKRTLEIFERLGCGQRMLDKGVTWQRGRVFFGTREIYAFDLQPEGGHRFPAFINIQQYHVERCLVERVRELERDGHPIEIRGGNRVAGVERRTGGVRLRIETPGSDYALEADWVIACDGAGSTVRSLLELDFTGRVFEDNFLIADVKMKAEFPTERWFWFDPPFNRNQSALLHKQPDDVWRIDLQLGPGIDPTHEKRPKNVLPRIRAMLGEEVEFDLEWVSVYTFQCRRMRRFRHGRVLFAGDAAHQVSPFGARGANGGVQDADNLCWKLALVVGGRAPERLLDSYDGERIPAADENIMNSTRSTDFLTPKSQLSRVFRDAVLDLSPRAPFARPLVNSGRLSLPATYSSAGADDPRLPPDLRPGAPIKDAPTADGWLLDRTGNEFCVLAIGEGALVQSAGAPLPARVLRITEPDDVEGLVRQRYVGEHEDGDGSAVYLLRPDQHVAARWPTASAQTIGRAIDAAAGRT